MALADLLWWQRRYADAIAIVESVPDTPDNFGGRGAASKAVILGRYHLDMGDIARARQYFSQVEGQARRDLAEVEAETDGDPRDLANVLQALADIELGLGRTDAAAQLKRSEQATVDGFEDKNTTTVGRGG